MATKNMARSVIEGGRAGYNKWQRRKLNRSDRNRSKEFTRRLCTLVDPDDAGPTPKRYPLKKEFSDKLGCMYRWLRSNIGAKWDAVFSDVSYKFDTRTVAGRHIVYAHLLNSVLLNISDIQHESPVFRSGTYFWVDEFGILNPKEVTQKRKRRKRINIHKWANNRMVMDYGVSIFWMNPTEIAWYNCGISRGKTRWGTHMWESGSSPCHRSHRVVTQLKRANMFLISEDSPLRRNLVKKIEIEYGIPKEVLYLPVEVRQCQRGAGPFLQGDRFSEEDVDIWNKLTEAEKYELLLVKPKSVMK